ncbi:hypothetical protein ABTN35_20125, partial [Acinetobacter baumannii]
EMLTGAFDRAGSRDSDAVEAERAGLARQRRTELIHVDARLIHRCIHGRHGRACPGHPRSGLSFLGR